MVERLVSTPKQVFLCTVGTLLEWYDFSLFAALSSIMSRLFFPESNPLAAMMSTLVVFALGFLMRPAGAIFFGQLGDRYGRKSALLLTIVLMTIATVSIGLIPTSTGYAMTLLVVCRLLQGFAASGEYPGGIVLLAEQENTRHPAFIASFGIFASVIGIGLGTGVCAFTSRLISDEAMLRWGWRIPFLLGAPIGLIAYAIRTSLLESSVFQATKAAGQIKKRPVLAVMQQHPWQLLSVICFYILSNVSFYVNFVYLTNYTVSQHKITLYASIVFGMLTTLAYAIAILFFGWVADYINKKRLMMFACISIALFVYPLFMMIMHGGLMAQLEAQIILSLLLGMFVGPLSFVSAHYFPTEVRYSGVGLSINVAASLFGGTTPLFCMWLVYTFNNPLAPAYYIVVCAIVACIAVWWRAHQSAVFLAWRMKFIL